MFDYILVVKALLILFLGVISPGPDFFMVLRNSLAFGRRAGITSALGIGSGCFISFTVLIAGLKFLFAYPLIKTGLSILCGCYLIYLGILSIKSKSRHNKISYKQYAAKSMIMYYRNGFFTNILNPKLYTVSGAILAYIEQQHPSIITNLGIIIGNAVIVFSWFACVAIILSHARIQTIYFGREQMINRVLGFVLIVVGAKVLLG